MEETQGRTGGLHGWVAPGDDERDGLRDSGHWGVFRALRGAAACLLVLAYVTLRGGPLR